VEVGGEAEAEFLHHLYHPSVVSAVLAVGEGVVSAVGEEVVSEVAALEETVVEVAAAVEVVPKKLIFYNNSAD
jgi:hypothetical protein